ncbi:hypothetical protein CVT24_009579 [Panaeolus cyanescens]|uniref:AAA+ ATPase domain-containing protein n=1 Tax=Panaeolus cyanescens TaxID=181874 RepID=A0A409YA66_9AGAR|nr:hypothetical protein CVT24_009579 [Panaeolus cyanescens]
MGTTDVIVVESRLSSEAPAAQSTSALSRWTVHVEARLKSRSSARFETIRSRVHAFITSLDFLALPSVVEGWENQPDLASAIERISVCESSCSKSSLTMEEMNIEVHVYQPLENDAFEEFSQDSNGRGDEDTSMAATVCELPNKSYEGLWDSLIYADNIKIKMLDYIHATLILSDANVDFNLVSWNRVVLFHGPPGTGKTSLCRALAQKLSIRLSHRYTHARLLEINSHSLFSKWFSESGKLVQRLFTSITELVEEEDGFVVVLIGEFYVGRSAFLCNPRLIDEVESLTAARAGAMAGTEPSDGLRVVNALLTQLDKLKHRKNVLIMSTSNLVKAIDSAFIDRADIVQYVDLPSREAVYEILRSCLCEIMNKGIIDAVAVPSLKEVRIHELVNRSTLDVTTSTTDPLERSKAVGLRLLALSAQCREKGLSGRSLRRLPVLALATYAGIGNIGFKGQSGTGMPVEVWLSGMEKSVADMGKERERIIS